MSTKTVEGIVTKILSQPSKYDNGGFLYTALLCDDNGNEHGVYYNFGTTKPPFEEGDRVKLGVEFQGAKRAKFVEGQGELVQRGAGVPAKPSGGNGGGYGGGKGKGGSGWDDPVRQKNIQYQSARKDALHLVQIALEHDALPLGSGKGKRYDELKAQVRKVTAELYTDLLDVDKAVQDADVPVQEPKPVGELPDRDVPAGNDDEIQLGDAEVEQEVPATGTGKF